MRRFDRQLNDHGPEGEGLASANLRRSQEIGDARFHSRYDEKARRRRVQEARGFGELE